MKSYSRELEIGRRVARQAGQIALQYRAKGLLVDSKQDLSPVTQADREAERYIAGALADAFPDDGLLGEEGSEKLSTSGRRWIIDPVDGTRDFIRGNPAWAVLLGLEANGEVLAGFAYFPELDRFFCASQGAGAYRDGVRLQASSIRTRAEAVLCVGGFSALPRLPFSGELLQWMSEFWAVRSFGGCMDAMMLAEGKADLWLETAAKPWDLAPLKIIAEEAGAVFFDFAGNKTIYGGNCVICAPGLESAAREFVLGKVGRCA